MLCLISVPFPPKRHEEKVYRSSDIITLSVFQPIPPLKAFKAAVFSHGSKINWVFHEKENAPRFLESLEATVKACVFLSSLSLIALFCSLPLHYAADEMNKSQQKCESLWV